MSRWLLRAIAVLLLCLPAVRPAETAPLDLPGTMSDQLRRSAQLLNWQRQRRSPGGLSTDAFFFSQPGFTESAPAKDSNAGLIPLSLQLSGGSQVRLFYGLAGPDQASRDPVAGSLRGFALNSGLGVLKSESQFFSYRPEPDAGAAATLANGFYRVKPAALGADRLQGGQAFKQNLELATGGLKLTGRFQDVDKSFAPAARMLSGGDADSVKRLQEMTQQRDTRRSGFGLSAGLSKNWAVTAGTDTLNDGAGYLRSQSFGLTGSLLHFNTSRRDVAAGFQGFSRFADAEVAKLAPQRGVQSRDWDWGFTPSKAFGFEGKRTQRRDAGGDLDVRTLGFHLGGFEYGDVRRQVAGFKTFASLDADGQKLAKIAGVDLRETHAGLALGKTSRLDYTTSQATDAGGDAGDRQFSLKAGSISARARFRDTSAGFKSFAGMAQLDPRYADLAAHKGLRESLYDLDYAGPSWLKGFSNHFERVRGGSADSKNAWSRVLLSNTLDLKLGANALQLYRLQSGTETAAGQTRQMVERYQLQRAIQKQGVLLLRHEVVTDRDAAGARKVHQSDVVQAKMDVGSLFLMDGQRTEHRISATGRQYQDTLNLTRKLGPLSAAWSFTDRADASGIGQAQKLTLGGKLWKGLSLTGSREVRSDRAPDGAGGKPAPVSVVADTRWTLTQELGKTTRLSAGFARVKDNAGLKAGEQTLRAEAQPVGSLVVATEFTQRQAAGKPLAIVQGFSLTDDPKERRFGWHLLYKHRSQGIGSGLETKGWGIRWKGLGKTPLSLAASFTRNAEEANGNPHPGGQSGLEVSAPVGGSLLLSMGYKHTADEPTRKDEERTQLSLTGALGADESLKLACVTQRNFDPAGSALQRTRLETLRLEYTHGQGDSEALSIGTDINYRTVDGASHSYGCDYSADVKWSHNF